MAQGRMLLRKISKNDQVPRLIEAVDADLGAPHGAYAALMFTWCIAHLDVEGRMHGDPRLVRADVFPLMDAITTAHVERYLTHFSACGLAVWYAVGGRKYLAFPSFDENQPGLRKEKEHESGIPAPEQGDAVIGGTLAPDGRNEDAEQSPEKKGKEGKGKEGKEKVPLELPGFDLGKPENTKQRKTVDQHLADASRVLEALSAARQRVMPSARPMRPTYTSLAGIAGRLEAGKTVDECMTVIANAEAESLANERSREFFDSVSPWRPENFERYLAKIPASRDGPTKWQGKTVGVGGVDRITKTGDLKL